MHPRTSGGWQGYAPENVRLAEIGGPLWCWFVIGSFWQLIIGKPSGILIWLKQSNVTPWGSMAISWSKVGCWLVESGLGIFHFHCDWRISKLLWSVTSLLGFVDFLLLSTSDISAYRLFGYFVIQGCSSRSLRSRWSVSFSCLFVMVILSYISVWLFFLLSSLLSDISLLVEKYRFESMAAIQIRSF